MTDRRSLLVVRFASCWSQEKMKKKYWHDARLCVQDVFSAHIHALTYTQTHTHLCKHMQTAVGFNTELQLIITSCLSVDQRRGLVFSVVSSHFLAEVAGCSRVSVRMKIENTSFIFSSCNICWAQMWKHSTRGTNQIRTDKMNQSHKTTRHNFSIYKDSSLFYLFILKLLKPSPSGPLFM